MKTTIHFARTNPNAIIPSKIEENAGMDVYPCFNEDYMIIQSNETKMIPTGIASVCSDDYYFQLFERSSTGTKGIGQRCGVIDSSYRGTWFVSITNHNNKPIIITKEKNEDVLKLLQNLAIVYPYSKAICQVVLLPVPKINIEEIDYETLKTFESERGIGCLDSTNK